MKNLIKLILLATLPVVLFSCKGKDGDDPKPADTYGTAQFKIANKAGDDDLVLNSSLYVNANGDTFKVTRYAYYLSNLELVAEDGSTFKVPNSYYLIDQADASTMEFSVADIPAKNYTKMKITLGIDSATNLSGAQTGVLDPLMGMYWDWNTGYINAKLEGFSPQSGGPINLLTFHLGGYSGPYSAVKNIELPFPQNLIVKEGSTPIVNLKSDLLEWFKGSPAFDFATNYSVMEIGVASYSLSERYKNHLSVSSVQN